MSIINLLTFFLALYLGLWALCGLSIFAIYAKKKITDWLQGN